MRRLIWIATLACAVAAASRAAVLEVDDDGGAPFATIQAAIDAAIPGTDDVLVRCGTYVENVAMRDGVSVRSERRGCAVIDGGDAGPAVTMTALGPATELAGFTIRHGRSLRGGGIRVDGGQPTITLNTIRDNGSPVFGDNFYDYGAGIYVSSAGFDPNTAPTISRNVIRDNSAFKGGGILLVDVHGAVVTSNLIVGNEGSFGGGMYSGISDATIVNNNFIDNTADYGGGLAAFELGGVLANNVFYLNYGEDFWTPTVNSVMYAANLSYANPPVFYPSNLPPASTIKRAPDFVNLVVDDVVGFEPRSSSPLIDAGAATAGVPAVDLRGVPRPLDGDVDGAAALDIGARENEGVTGVSHDGAQFTWDPVPASNATFNVYRGDLAVLRDLGVYTQDPLSVPGARRFCGGGIGLADADEPPPGAGYFYLTAAVGAIEGGLGFAGDLAERSNDLGCIE